MKSKLVIIFIAAYLLTGCAGAISKKHYKESTDLLYSSDDGNKLIEMAEKRFGKLTESDKILFNAVIAGKSANYCERNDKDKPEDANSWGEKRIIDANRIEWLCRDRQAKELVTDKGIQVTGAKIKEAIDLSFAEIPFPLVFQGCVFNKEINILYSRIKFLYLAGSHTGSIWADGVKVESSVFLRNGFKAEGDVRFLGAVIGKDFDCEKGEFINKGHATIQADGINVEGSIFLRNGFKAKGEVRFPAATIGGSLDCGNGKFINEGGKAITADGMNVKAVVSLDDSFEANGITSFTGASIGENFDCSNGKFINKGGKAIIADKIDVKGTVFLSDGFKVEGEVRFSGAVIGGDFVCEKGDFINKGGTAIFADGMDVKGGIFLRNDFRANGGVSFSGAAIGGDFDCTDSNFINENDVAIIAVRMDVKGNVVLTDGFKAKGMVCFPGATIGRNFICSNGEFISEDGMAILADGMDVKGDVFLGDGFKAKGEVSFPRAVIGGNFNCSKGEFINDGNTAILADGMDVKGDVFLGDGFKAKGEVSFSGAVIGGSFDCNGGNFINEKGVAIFADGMDVKGIVFLGDGFKANGEVCFSGATIGREFICEKAEFINEGGTAISAEGMVVKIRVFLGNGLNVEGRVSLVGATVGEHFFLHDVNLSEKTILDLRNAKTGVLWDDANSWPTKGKLFLDGFVYENIGDKAPKDARSRIEWLNRQDENQFQPGPYEQLAKVLEKIGHNEDAKKILIEKEKKMTRLGGFGLPSRLWRDFLGVTIGYGYRPMKALRSIGAFILFGFIVFRSGYKAGVIVPADKETYHKFNALVYSIEMFLPVVDLRMAKHWIPDANKWWGYVIRWYMWIHIGAGWILTTLWIVGLTGLIKK